MTSEPESNASLTGLRRIIVIATLLFGGITTPLLFTVPAPILVQIATRYGGGDGGAFIAQLAMTLPAAGILIGSALSGLAVQRVGARRLLLVCAGAYTALAASAALIESAPLLLATRFLAGVASAGASVATTTLLSLLFVPRERTRFISYLGAVGAGSGVISLLLSGALAELGGWRMPFLLYLVGLLILLAGWIVLPDRRVAPAAADSTSREALRGLVPVYIAVVFVYIVAFMTGTQAAFLLAAKGVTAPASQALIISCASIASAVGGLCYPALARRIGHGFALAILLLALGIGNMTMGAASLPLVTAIGCALVGFGGGLASPHFINLIVDRVELSLAGRAIGLCYSSIFIGEFANPLIVTPLRMAFGIEQAFMIVGAATALAGLLVLGARRPRASAAIP